MAVDERDLLPKKIRFDGKEYGIDDFMSKLDDASQAALYERLGEDNIDVGMIEEELREQIGDKCARGEYGKDFEPSEELMEKMVEYAKDKLIEYGDYDPDLERMRWLASYTIDEFECELDAEDKGIEEGNGEPEL